MELEYVIANPTGNITALVLTPVPPPAQPRIAAKLMAREPTVEQTGFLSLTARGVELRMAGGEFCGNATLSAGAVYANALGLRAGEKLELPIRVSGVPESVKTELEVLPDGSYSGAVDMPRPLSMGLRHYDIDGETYFLPHVVFPGITHIIAPGNMGRQTAEYAAREWCARHKAPALGLMLFDEKSLRVEPLVYVPGSDTLFWESSCASGTAAVGVWLSAQDGRACSLTFSEPGGCLSVETTYVMGPVRLGGHVRLGERKMSEEHEN